MSIRYLVPELVVQYIEEHNLYDDDNIIGNSKEHNRADRRPGETGGVAPQPNGQGPSNASSSRTSGD